MKRINKDILKENMKKRIAGDTDSGKVAGAAVCIMQNDMVLYRDFFGCSDAETKKPITESNLFRMASMTKPVTAVCILILEERGLLKISDPISKYLPGFKNMFVGRMDNGKVCMTEKAEKEITIEMILSHKSGIGTGETGIAQLAKMTEQDKYSLETAVRFYEDTFLAFQPGQAEGYSGVAGFDVLARIAEIRSGMPFAEFAKENIFIPLKMNDTTFTPSEEQWGRMVKMSDFSDGKAVNAPMPQCVFNDFPATYACGGAGLVSSLDDYVKFAQMLLHGGIYDGVRVFSEESVQKMRTPNPPLDLSQINEVWGLGVRVNKDKFYKRLPEGTFGWSGAYGTHFFVDAENKITAVYMKNSWFDGGSGAVTAANFEEDVYSALSDI